MKQPSNRNLRRLLAALAIAAVGLPTASHAAVTRWNVQAARTAFPTQTINGYFDYDTTAGTVTGWSLAISNMASPYIQFSPAPNDVLTNCGAPACVASVTPGPTPANAFGPQLGFWNALTPNLFSGLFYYVGLTLPVGADLSGSTTQVINLVGGYPYSIAVAEDQSDVVNGLNYGYAEFDVNGTISFGGTVVAGLPGGSTPSAPVALATAVTGNPQIGQISTFLGGSYSCSQFYSFYSLGGSNWTATAAITGAAAGSSYTFEILNARGTRIIQQVTLNAANNFQSPLIVPTLAPGSYVIGLVGNNPNDPPATISFTNPVTPHKPSDDGAGDR